MALNINGTTGISGVDGSASAASIAGTDANTGLSFASDTVNVNTGGVTRATVDSSGNLNIPNDSGKIQLGTGADLQIYHDGGGSYLANSTGILRLQAKSGENSLSLHPDGQVELYHNHALRCETTGQGIKITGTDSGGGRVIPAADNAGYIGEGSNRWIAVYAVNGSIQTSDKTEKNTIVESDLGLNFVNKLKPVSYKWNAKQLGNKTHYGLIAQDIEEAVKSEGKTLDDFAAVTKEDGVAMGLGYCELISPLIKAIQELSTEVTTLKTKVAALEAG
jgi:hypothetical protein